MRVFQDARRVSLSAVAAVVLTAVRSLLVMRILEPGAMGVWKSATLLYIIAGSLRLSISLGMSLRVPVLAGEGRKDEAERVSAAAGFALFMVGLLFGVAVFVYSFFATGPASRMALRLMAVVVFVAQPYQFLRNLALTGRQFGVRAREVLIAAVTDFAAGVALSYWFGLGGVGTAMILSITVPGLYLARRLELPRSFSFDRLRLKQTIEVGLPFSFADYGFVALRYMDTLLMTFLLGPAAVGYYSLSMLINDFSMFLTRLGVAEVISPHMLHQYGKDRSHRHVAVFYETPARLFCYVLPPLLAAGTLLAPHFVRFFMPQYMPGIAAAQIALWGSLFLALHSTVGSFLSVAGRMKAVLRAFVIVLAVAACIHWNVMKAGMSLAWVALTSVGALAAITTAELWIARRGCGHSPLEVFRYLTSLYFPVIVALILTLAALPADFSSLAPGLDVAAKVALVLAFYAPVLALYEIRFSLLREVCQGA